jgi:hypothetical protein
MPRQSTRNTAPRPSGSERIFMDALNRRWSATYTADEDGGGAIIFTCVSEVRNSGRAIAVKLPHGMRDVEEETLRAWLEVAPRIGTLT